MPDFHWRGYDKEGKLKTGERFVASEDILNKELFSEGISVTKISMVTHKLPIRQRFLDLLHGKKVFLNELAVFARQMQLLHQATVPMTTAIKQLAVNTHSSRLAQAMNGLVNELQKGKSLSMAMKNYPDEFSPMMVSLVEVGESTGHLSEAFGHIYEYLDFEASNIKEIRTAFRYPIFVISSVLVAVIILNLYVVPTFSRFYINLKVPLPWETKLLIASSNFFTNYFFYIVILGIAFIAWFVLYIRKPEGRYRWDKFKLSTPVFGRLLKRTILIRFSQSLSIMLNAQLSVTHALALIRGIIQNAYIAAQITEALEAIERGSPFTQAITKINLFSSLEMQILSVGEKNGELSPALDYISSWNKQEITYDLKRLTDILSPILTSVIAILVLVIALGVYLPIWNMINLVHPT